ncbi:MAG: ATP-binding protein [Planctomycetes bacterium]|nr:ATP-binding protein [Planctomycetota bacterium]
MARSDLVLSLIEAGVKGDQARLRRTVEALIADERAKQHNALADRLDRVISKQPEAAANVIADQISSTDLFSAKTPERQLSELVLPSPITKLVRQMIEEQHRSELLKAYNLKPRHRLIAVGPPGNGKTSLAEAIAYELMVPLITLSYEGIIGSYLGQTAQRLGRLFSFVRQRSCVLFIDEFDALGKERGDLHETGEIKRVVNSLLLQIDSLPSHVVLVAASNHEELLDRAAWRRFEIKIDLPKPTVKQRIQWLSRLKKSLKQSLGYDIEKLARKLAGASFSDLEQFSLNIRRRYVLEQPQSSLRKIVNSELSTLRSRKGRSSTSGQ